MANLATLTPAQQEVFYAMKLGVKNVAMFVGEGVKAARLTVMGMKRDNIAISFEVLRELSNEFGVDFGNLITEWDTALANARAALGGATPNDWLPDGWMSHFDNLSNENDKHNTLADNYVAAVAEDIDGDARAKHQKKDYIVGLVMNSVDNLVKDPNGNDTKTFNEFTNYVVLDANGLNDLE